MEEVITLYTLQAGNNHLFGSKGVGRQLINISLAIDRAFMNFIDSMYLAALLTAEADPSKIAQMQPQVTNPFLVVPDGMKLTGIEVNVNVDAFTSLKNQLTQIAEQIAGTFMPASVENNGQSVQTATEASIDAQREEEIRQGILNRWMTQFYRMIGSMQTRAFSTANIKAAIKVAQAKNEALAEGKQIVTAKIMEQLEEISDSASEMYEEEPDLKDADPEAVATILNLIEEGLSPEEILVIANAPASTYSANVGAQEDAKFLQFYPTVKGDPNWDQNRLEEAKGIAMIGPDKTKEMFLPNPGQTTQLEAQRQQMTEFNDMLAGTQMPVSGRDSHMDHLQALGPLVGAKLATLHQMASNPQGALAIPIELLKSLGMSVQHAAAHIQELLKSGKTKAELAPVIKAQKEAEAAIKDITTKVMQANQAHQANLQQAAAAVQQPDPNAPPHPEMAFPPGHPQGVPHNQAALPLGADPAATQGPAAQQLAPPSDPAAQQTPMVPQP